METLKTPYNRLNRQGRRAEVAMQRKAPQFMRVYKARMQYDRESDARKAGLEKRLDAVRARTKARKGQVNNPRFR